MSEQVTAIKKALYFGFILSLISPTVSVISNNLEPYEFDFIDIWNPEVISYWVGRITVVPILFVVVAILWKRKSETVGKSILNGLLAITLSIAVAIPFPIALNAFYPVNEFPYAQSGKVRDRFLKTVFDGCVSSIQSSAQDSANTENFCLCYAEGMAAQITLIDLKAFNTPEGAENWQDKAAKVAEQCKN